ncbi:MAG: hypothetical protein P1P88_03055 [Bacteroidales bacterium]|nr:hypothetical protein [Bacteroidales bacterium]
MNNTSIISPAELDAWIENGMNFQLVDISLENLLKDVDILSDWIPVTNIINEIDKLKKDVPIVLCCRHGNDSFILMNIMHVNFGKTNVLSLKSGLYGWKPALAK